VLGLPLGDPALKVNAAVMINLLGESTLEATLDPIPFR
jgi:phosphoribosylaminoimidazole carboxylase (NCAIR synthetase)